MLDKVIMLLYEFDDAIELLMLIDVDELVVFEISELLDDNDELL